MWRRIIPVALMLLTSALVNGQSVDRAAIEKVVREYIVLHPELLVESITQYQEEQKVLQREHGKEVIATKRRELEQDPSSPAAGQEGGMTLVEFFDYRCGYCKKSAGAIAKLMVDHPEVRIVFKEFPLLGPDSMVAAKAALAANRQGRYLEFHRALMALTNPPTIETIEQLAKGEGLDVPRLMKDMASPESSAAIERNLQLAEQLGITGTPTFVFNGDLVRGAQDTASLDKLLATLSKKP